MNKIIILPGWTYSLDKWSELVGLLEQSGFEVKLLKIPGLTQKSSEVWNLKKYVLWLNQLLTKEHRRVILLGHSNGGRIALAFALKYPQKIKKLILVDSAGIFHNEISIKIKRSFFILVAKVGKRFTDSRILRKLLYKLAREQDYERASSNMRKTMLNLLKTDLKPRLAQIKIPTLIIWGENDKITPLSDGLIFKKSIRESKLEVINGARHSPFYTHAREVAEIINDF